MIVLATLGIVAQARSSPGAEAAAGAFFLVYLMTVLLIGVATAAGMWGVFAKAGEPGWAAIVPIYNVVVLFRITGLPVWYIVLLFIPCLGAIASLVFSVMV